MWPKVNQAVGPVEIGEDQVKQVIVRGDAAGVTVGEALQNSGQKFKNWSFRLGMSFVSEGRPNDGGNEGCCIRCPGFCLVFFLCCARVQFSSLRLPVVFWDASRFVGRALCSGFSLPVFRLEPL